MKKVDFFIVGQAKSGTSALAAFLSQHPDVFMSDPKEPGYFASDIIGESDEYHGKQIYMKARSLKEYENYYSGRATEKLLGDATPIYFYSKVAAKNIKKYNPKAKIIIILRNPVDFLQAMHMQYVNDGSEDETDFEKALKKEPSRKKGQSTSKNAVAPSLHFYTERAKYYQQAKRYVDAFGKDSILFLTQEDFVKDNQATMDQIFDFLDIKKVKDIDFKKVNASKAPRSKLIHKTLNNVRLKNTIDRTVGRKNYKKMKNMAIKVFMKEQQRKQMSPELREELMQITKDDVKRTEKLTGMKLQKIWGYK